VDLIENEMSVTIHGMASLAFDTHKFVKELTGAGMDLGLAEVLAGNYADLLVDRLATKDDLKALEDRLNGKMEALEDRLNGKMVVLEERLTNRIERAQTRTIVTVTGILGFLILILRFYG